MALTEKLRDPLLRGKSWDSLKYFGRLCLEKNKTKLKWNISLWLLKKSISLLFSWPFKKEKEGLNNKATHFRQNVHTSLCNSFWFCTEHGFFFCQLKSPWEHFMSISCPLVSQWDDLSTIPERQLFAEYCSLLSSRELWPSAVPTFTENHRHSHSNLLTYRESNFSLCIPSSRSRNNLSVTDLNPEVFQATICASPLILHEETEIWRS